LGTLITEKKERRLVPPYQGEGDAKTEEALMKRRFRENWSREAAVSPSWKVLHHPDAFTRALEGRGFIAILSCKGFESDQSSRQGPLTAKNCRTPVVWVGGGGGCGVWEVLGVGWKGEGPLVVLKSA